MDYERLPVILKRYSFIEKMRVLQYYSKQIMNIHGIELTSGQPMTWELETFLLFAVKADEYNDNDFKGKNINKFIEMINCIKEHQHPTLVNKIGTIEFADFLLIALGSTQFDIQTYNIYKYYRYNYFFTYVSNKIDMKKEFYKKFNVDYNSFLELGSILSFFCSLKVNLDPQILRYIILKYSKNPYSISLEGASGATSPASFSCSAIISLSFAESSMVSSSPSLPTVLMSISPL